MFKMHAEVFWGFLGLRRAKSGFFFKKDPLSGIQRKSDKVGFLRGSAPNNYTPSYDGV